MTKEQKNQPLVFIKICPVDIISFKLLIRSFAQVLSEVKGNGMDKSHLTPPIQTVI